ncbi:helix-turn-helix domain-containing protein [Aggregatilinea lenta]|uniref:helix-turn-helix domain-containing protein n=1 Tax=Aggregatilinea lenta TaxID=913108 RepID=UPI0013C360B7|nr:helix-turn-helix domain-containing protein [Aggregatilinea lenta]
MPDELHETAGEEAAQQLITLSEAAERFGLSHSHLRLLVRQGKVWGTKLGFSWVTTEAAVNTYLATDRRPGPKKNE